MSDNSTIEWTDATWNPVKTMTEAMEQAAREMAKPIREQLAIIRNYYDQVEIRMLSAETPAETSRHANEMAGLKFAYDLIAPHVYTTEELAQ